MTKKNFSLLFLSFVYVMGGINHFANSEFYLKIMPWYLPMPLKLIYISGICEIILGIGVIPLKTRKVSLMLVITMLIVFLLVHIQTPIDTYQHGGVIFWISVMRLPLQFVLIRWAWLLSKKHTKPFSFKNVQHNN